MRVVDWAPFLVAFIAGAAAGALTRRMARFLAAAFPGGHLILSIATGRAKEGFLDYVVPVNLAVLAFAVIGVLVGRRIPKRRSP